MRKENPMTAEAGEKIWKAQLTAKSRGEDARSQKKVQKHTVRTTGTPKDMCRVKKGDVISNGNMTKKGKVGMGAFGRTVRG